MRKGREWGLKERVKGIHEEPSILCITRIYYSLSLCFLVLRHVFVVSFTLSFSGSNFLRKKPNTTIFTHTLMFLGLSIGMGGKLEIG